ncbi:MAG: DUF2911 domain-containing protein [Gemmatimonadales bacterium]
MLVALVMAIVFGGMPEVPSFPLQDLSCIIMNDSDPATRPSPLDSVMFSVGGTLVKVCYGRPSAKGRTMIGGSAVPYDKIWRTGANEPSMIHTSGRLSVAGIEIGPGSYSVYSVPGEHGWQIVLNRSTTQWGHERFYSGDVAAQEIGRADVESLRTSSHVESFTIRTESSADMITLILEWENTLVTVPIRQG